MAPVPNNKNRQPRLLWANSYCLLDKSSGASISVNQILRQFANNGYQVKIVGATIFDDAAGARHLQKEISKAKDRGAKKLVIKHGGLDHVLLVTEALSRHEMKLKEANDLYQLYINALDTFVPDCVFFYGGNPFDFFISQEARVRGIPSAAYLVNSNYKSARWCRDVDLIVTDTKATANMYEEKVGFVPKPIGKFIDPADVIAKHHDRKHVTLVNPSWEKGAGIVAILAIMLEQKRPDITFEVVESRGNWEQVLRAVSKKVFKKEISKLNNVILQPSTDKMSDVYSRSRVVLGLSQWWESGSRVLAEAMLNGIPAIVSSYGGGPEMVGSGGIVVDLPKECHEHPFLTFPTTKKLKSIADFIEKLWDDESFYLALVSKALHQGLTLHQINASTKRLLSTFEPLISLKAGDNEISKKLCENHKHQIYEIKNKSNSSFKGPKEKKNKNILTEIDQEIHKVSEIKDFHFFNYKCGFELNLINPGGEWILEKLSHILHENFSSSREFSFDDPSLYDSQNSPLNEKNKINYFIHYNLFQKKSQNIDCAYFTHVEEDVENLKNKFINCVELVDGPIFQNEMYFNRYKNINRNSTIIPTAVDDHFSCKIKLGVIGRNYTYTDRKNTDLIKKLSRLPYIEFAFSNGTLANSELPNFYRSCDYVFVASKHEGGPMCLQEALACGKEVILPRGVGMASMFKDAKGIHFYDHSNVAGLVNMLEKKISLKNKIADAVKDNTWAGFVAAHEVYFQTLWKNRE